MLWSIARTQLQPAFIQALIKYLFQQYHRRYQEYLEFRDACLRLYDKIQKYRMRSSSELAAKINKFIPEERQGYFYTDVPWGVSNHLFCKGVDDGMPDVVDRERWRSVMTRRVDEGVKDDWPWWILFSIWVIIKKEDSDSN